MFSAHAVLAIAAAAVAAPAAVAQTELKLADLESPETVSTWLRLHGNNADRSMAKRMFDIGARARDQRNNWGPAYKGFAESALIYPAPETLVEYANATLHGIAEMQGRDGAREARNAVLSQVLRLLTSAQAARDNARRSAGQRTARGHRLPVRSPSQASPRWQVQASRGLSSCVCAWPPRSLT